MKIEVKPKIVRRFLIIFWSCFFIIWFFLKKLPEINDYFVAEHTIQNMLTVDSLDDFNITFSQFT